MEDRTFFLLSRLATSLKSYLRKELKIADVDLTPGQIGILFSLRRENTMTMSELANRIKTDNAATTRLVDQLVKSAYVTRESNPQDRRQWIVSLTSEGTEIAKKALKVVNKTNIILREKFSEDEIKTLNSMASTLIAEFE